MSNRLVESNSPYLLQHADNPVDWYPWGPEALEKARQEDKPIFLSIGYAACHWCHVMEHESFEDPEIARIMNENFVNVKVDREERPDLDSIYMNAVVALTGHGGWPMSVFLTPDGKPFYGGTYFPPAPRYNMPSFKDVLLSIAKTWKEDRERAARAGEELTGHINASYSVAGSAAALKPETLEQAALSLAQSYDWKFGGWGQAPKFPQPMAIEFLLNRAARGDKLALEIATHALRAMAKGGMYDLVGGGFARYSTDNEWLVPHFEKMLYDNAQLALAYLHSYLLTGEAGFRRVCEETLKFMTREMTHPEGGFYSSLDADSEGEEGKYYVWSLEEVRGALPEASDAELVIAAYGLTEQGNFEGNNVFQRALDDESLAERFQIDQEQVQARLDRALETLLEVRSRRIRPLTDDKILTAWNALALSAFAQAGRYLDPAYAEVAMRNAAFLLDELLLDGRLHRSWRDGRAQHDAYLEDYAALALGLLDLYQSDPNPRWFAAAEELVEEMVEHFQDPQGGFFDTRDDHEQLVTRPKDLQDNATSSGNALAASALLLTSAYTGRSDWRELAESMLASVQEASARYPTAFSKWLCAADLALFPSPEVAILGDLQDPQTQALISTLWAAYRPNSIAAISSFPPAPEAPALLAGRPLVDGRPSAYVCENFVCLRPVTTPEELLAQLQAASRPS